jgi:glutamyl-tRNA reductase
MVFVAFGVNHKTAPVHVREQVALLPAAQNTLLHNLLRLPEINEAVILSTCNRTEVYCETQNPDILPHWLADAHQLSLESIAPFLFMHKEEEAVKHVLRVASGLDSMMIGEPQILGQMKQSYQQACVVGAINTQLRPIFEYLFSAAKRIRTQSGIGTNPVSVAYAAVALIGQLFKDYRPLTVLLIGSGETSTLVAKYLHQHGVKQFIIASRTLENAQKLADTFGGTTIAITDIQHHLPKADVVVSATTCPVPFINKSLVQDALNLRQHPMFLLDLAVPRDIEADVAALEHAHLYNIDDLYAMIEKSLEERRQAASLAEELIDEELKQFICWHRSLKAKDLICDYRTQMSHLAHNELQRAMNKLEAGHCHHSVLNEFSERLVNKLTHGPTVGLRQMAWDDQADILRLAQYLFHQQSNQI